MEMVHIFVKLATESPTLKEEFICKQFCNMIATRIIDEHSDYLGSRKSDIAEYVYERIHDEREALIKLLTSVASDKVKDIVDDVLRQSGIEIVPERED